MKRSIVVCVLFLCGSCGIKLDSVILRPSANFRLIPSDLGYQFEETNLIGRDGSPISIWHVRPTGTSKGILVIIPGNDANKGRYAVSLPIFVDKGWEVVVFDYPGYGKSPGTPSLQGLLDSTRTVLDYAFDHDDVVAAMGVSLGTAVLARVAVEYDLTACVFESTTNFWEISSDFLRYHKVLESLGGLADWVAAAGTSPDFDMKRWIVDVKAPKLFIHSPDDTVTPFDGAFQVFKLAPQPKHMFVTQGDHAHQLFLDPVLYRSVVNGWLDGVLRTDPISNPRFQQQLDEELRSAFAEYGLAPTQ